MPASIATILVHTTEPAKADETLDAVRALEADAILTADRVVTAYDLVVRVTFAGEHRLAAVVKRLQDLPTVARTLTLVHVPEEG